MDLQINALTLAGCDMIYRDHGVSGMVAERGGLDALLEDIKPGDTLVVWKLDRLGRSLSNLIFLIQGIVGRDIGFCSLKDMIDTSTAGGRFSFHIMAALAEFERDMISERTKAGIKAAKARGVTIGRPRKLTPKAIIEINLRRAKGHKVETLAKEHSVHPRTIARYLKSIEES